MPTLCLPLAAESIERAVELLAAGLPIAVPSETVYGLAANAMESVAVQRIYAAKGRPSDNPLIVHVGDRTQNFADLVAQGLAKPLPAGCAQRSVAERLLKRFWPGPLTLVLPRGPRVPDCVAASLPTVALRMPSHPGFLQLLAKAPFPLAAPSANRSNRISPTSARDVLEELDGRIPLILDGGTCEIGLESTIVSVEADGSVRLLRHGGTPTDEIERTTQAAVVRPAPKSGQMLAPGMGRVHYAPNAPIALVGRGDTEALQTSLRRLGNPGRIGVLLLAGDASCPPAWADTIAGSIRALISLGDQGDGRTASRRLFSELRGLDRLGLDLIVVESPDRLTGELWPALQDRLARAAAATL